MQRPLFDPVTLRREIARVREAGGSRRERYRIAGETTWLIEARTDKTEEEHRVDWLAGRLWCTCLGFINHKHCEHVDGVKEYFMNEQEEERALTVAAAGPTDLARTSRSPEEMTMYLATIKQQREIVATFFRDVMEEGYDYGVIPGTEKPTLLKPGAENLCDLFGYAPVIRNREEARDDATGFYRVVIYVGLVDKKSGVLVGEGVGEANTRESRYFYRWVPEWKLPEGVDKRALKSEKRTYTRKRDDQYGKKGTRAEYTTYRLENDDLFTLHNTVLKMAKKRALVDAVLPACRASGIFAGGMDQEHSRTIQDWIDAEFEDITDDEDDQPTTSSTVADTVNTPEALPSAPSDLLRLIGERQGDERKAAGVRMMQQFYGTAVITSLKGTDRTEFVERLKLWLQPDGHEHELAYTPSSFPVCRRCGIEMDDAPAAAGAQQAPLADAGKDTANGEE